MGLKYLLDTNVLSEISKPYPDAKVLSKIEQYRKLCATASLVMHELKYGVERLSPGKVKSNQTFFIQQLERGGFPVLPYDNEAADWHAKQRVMLVSQGKTPPFVDGQIAAIAAVNDLTLVTRNQRDFENFTHLAVENWWD